MVGLRIQTTSLGPWLISSRQHVEIGGMKAKVFGRRYGEADQAEEKERNPPG